MQQINENYNEISIRELIEVLLKGWRMIAIITVVCLLSSGILSFLILDPTYEAKTILMASDTTAMLTNLKDNKENIAGVLDLLATYPTMTLQTYKEQIKNPQLLQQVIDELELGKYEIDSNELIEMIDLKTIPDTNLISVSVTYKDPKLAAEIANTLTNKFSAFITVMSRQQASKTSQFLTGQLEVEKKKLDEATLEQKEFLSQPRGADELREEFDSKLKMLTTFKTELVEKEVELYKVKAGLTISEQELKSIPQLIVTNKSVGQDPLLNQIISEANGTSIRDTAQITMKSEEVNVGYVSLRTKVSEYRIAVAELSGEMNMIRTKIDTTQKELENIQSDLADKEHRQESIQRNVDLSQGTYDAFLNKYEESRITESTEVGDSTINIISQAVVPDKPIGPKKMLNLVIAGVLGIVIGVFLALFKEFWQSSGKQLEVSK
jgi:polysaccharide biosynthesis transport protein